MRRSPSAKLAAMERREMNRGYVSKSHTHEARHCTGPHAEIFICRTIISLCYDSVTR
jgi:hypothetical protein